MCVCLGSSSYENTDPTHPSPKCPHTHPQPQMEPDLSLSSLLASSSDVNKHVSARGAFLQVFRDFYFLFEWVGKNWFRADCENTFFNLPYLCSSPPPSPLVNMMEADNGLSSVGSTLKVQHLSCIVGKVGTRICGSLVLRHRFCYYLFFLEWYKWIILLID